MPGRARFRSRLHEAARGMGYVLVYGCLVLVAGALLAAAFVWVM